MFHDIYSGSSLPTHRYSESFTILLAPSTSVTLQSRSRSPASVPAIDRASTRLSPQSSICYHRSSFIPSFRFPTSGWGGALDQYTRSLMPWYLCPSTSIYSLLQYDHYPNITHRAHISRLCFHKQPLLTLAVANYAACHCQYNLHFS